MFETETYASFTDYKDKGVLYYYYWWYNYHTVLVKQTYQQEESTTCDVSSTEQSVSATA